MFTGWGGAGNREVKNVDIKVHVTCKVPGAGGSAGAGGALGGCPSMPAAFSF